MRSSDNGKEAEKCAEKEKHMDQRVVTVRALQAFEGYLWNEDRQRGTIEKYLRDVRAFAAWLGGGEVSRAEAVRWRDHLLNQGYAPATINSMVAALNTFFRFAGWEDCRVKFLKVQRKLFRDKSRELTRQEYGRLIAAARGQGKERLALLMEAMCATGIRVSEVRYLTVEAARRGRAEVSLKGKIRTILIPNKLCRKLLKYAKKQKTASGEIFLTGSGKGLSRRQIWAEMKGLCQAAGVESTKVFPHNLRHLFATAFYRVCRDIARLADVLGHSNIENTWIYLVTSGAEHSRTLEQMRLVS